MSEKTARITSGQQLSTPIFIGAGWTVVRLATGSMSPSAIVSFKIGLSLPLPYFLSDDAGIVRLGHAFDGVLPAYLFAPWNYMQVYSEQVQLEGCTITVVLERLR